MLLNSGDFSDQLLKPFFTSCYTFFSPYSTPLHIFFTKAVSQSGLITVLKTYTSLFFPAMCTVGFAHSHPGKARTELPGLLLLSGGWAQKGGGGHPQKAELTQNQHREEQRSRTASF